MSSAHLHRSGEQPFVFRKTMNGLGQAPEGDEVYVFLPARFEGTEDEARNRAWRIFKRDRPDENPMAWEIRSGALGGKGGPT